MAYRFVHAADIHLDSPLRSLALRNPELASLVGNATRQAFVRIVDICLDEGVDALLLAGDLYDGEQTSMTTARFLADQLGRLHGAGIRTFIIRGNHDALSKITRELVFPGSVRVFGGRADAIALDRAPGGLDIVVHGLSFRDRHAPESLLPDYRAPVADAVNVGLMHTSLGGGGEHSLYAPCAIGDLHASGFDYWALGHVHGRTAHPVSGRHATVVMPGMPQGRDINEAGPKSVTLVTVADDRGIRIEERLTSVAQFERLAVDLGAVADWAGAVASIEARLGEARAAAASDHLVARVTLSGTTPLAWQLRRDADALRTEIEFRAHGLGGVWIDRIEIDCRAAEAAGAAMHGDPLVELRDLVHRDVLGSAAFQAEMTEIVADLSRKLPKECRDAVLGADDRGADIILARLLAEGAEDVLARLREPAGREAA